MVVSVDSTERSLQTAERYGLTFPLLSDSGREAIRQYGVIHSGSALDGTDIALPAHFLIDTDGRIVWRRVAVRVQDRPDPKEVLKAFGTALGPANK